MTRKASSRTPSITSAGKGAGTPRSRARCWARRLEAEVVGGEDAVAGGPEANGEALRVAVDPGPDQHGLARPAVGGALDPVDGDLGRPLAGQPGHEPGDQAVEVSLHHQRHAFMVARCPSPAGRRPADGPGSGPLLGCRHVTRTAGARRRDVPPPDRRHVRHGRAVRSVLDREDLRAWPRPATARSSSASGIGKYPNRGVMDAYAGVSRGIEQWTVRASRQLGADGDAAQPSGRSATRCSSPCVVSGSPSTPTTWSRSPSSGPSTGSSPPALENHEVHRGPDGFRVDADIVRYHHIGDGPRLGRGRR